MARSLRQPNAIWICRLFSSLPQCQLFVWSGAVMYIKPQQWHQAHAYYSFILSIWFRIIAVFKYYNDDNNAYLDVLRLSNAHSFYIIYWIDGLTKRPTYADETDINCVTLRRQGILAWRIKRREYFFFLALNGTWQSNFYTFCFLVFQEIVFFLCYFVPCVLCWNKELEGKHVARNRGSVFLVMCCSCFVDSHANVFFVQYELEESHYYIPY